MTYAVKADFSATDNISDIARGIGGVVAEMAGGIVNSFSGVASGFDIGSAAVGLYSAGLNAVVDIGMQVLDFHEQEQAAMASFAATTGASAEAVDKFKQQSEGLFSTGLVGDITEAAGLVGEMNRQLTDLGNWSPDDFTTNIAGIAKAWDINGKQMIDDIADITNKFDDLAGKPDYVADSLVRMSQVTGEPIDDLSKAVVKIGSQLAAAGVSGSNTMGLIAQAANNGVTNFGPLGGAIQKFHDQLINPPAGFSKAIHDLGLEDVAKKAKAGGISMDETLEIIFGKLDAIKDPAKRAQLAIELFGKGSEKAFGDNIGKMKGFTNALGDVNGAAKGVAATMADDGTFMTALGKLKDQILTDLNTKLDYTYHVLKDSDWKGAASNMSAAVTNEDAPIVKTINGWISKIEEFLSKLAEAAQKGKAGGGAGNPAITNPNALPGGSQGGSNAGANQTSSDPVAAAQSKYGGSLYPKKDKGQNQAAGGMMGEGWGWVGEEGPELRYKHGASVEVFSASESRKMVQGSGAAAGGSGASITITGNTFVGTGGLAELGRLITPYLQQESQRRIERT